MGVPMTRDTILEQNNLIKQTQQQEKKKNESVVTQKMLSIEERKFFDLCGQK